MRKLAAVGPALLLAVVLIGSPSLGAPWPSAVRTPARGAPETWAAAGSRPTVHAAGRGTPWSNLQDGVELKSTYDRAADLRRPLSLAAGDFDEDGVQDLVTGYAGGGGGLVTLHRGNIDALYPHTRAAAYRRKAGTFVDSPFLSAARVFGIPVAPDFLATGDFDADGHADVVVAARGTRALYWLPGDGHGALGSARRIDLPGAVTQLLVGEMNRQDGLEAVVVGIVSAEGPQVLVFEAPQGALTAHPEAIVLPAEASALALGQMDEDRFGDLAIAAGRELLIVHGRDRQLSSSDARPAAGEPIERRSLPAVITGMVLGDFRGSSAPELAMLADDGAVYIASVATGALDVIATVPTRGARLVRARISGLRQDDLLVMDATHDQLHILMGAGTPERGGRPTFSPLSIPVSLDVVGSPVAVLPMRLNGDALSDLVVLRTGQGAPTVVMTDPVAIFAVTNTNDSGVGSLRQAIIDANASPGADAIYFDIPTAAVPTITLLSALPAITGAVTLDGTTQPALQVELNGASAGAAADGLLISGGNSVVRGLVINRFGDDGIQLNSGSNVIEGNLIGTDTGGSLDQGNGGDGVVILGTSSNRVGGTTAAARNIISGNNGNGLFITGSLATRNVVQGNRIGTTATGAAGLGNTQAGVRLNGAPGNTIGGTTAATGNLISANSAGILITGAGATGNLVQGNFIGTNPAGTAALGQVDDGVVIDNAPGNTIGGTVAAARNVISGNGGDGIFMINAASGNLVQGNYIGTNAAGTAAVGNFNGVHIGTSTGSAPGNTIGGTVTGAGNVISGNLSNGVAIDSAASGNLVQGNFIGTNAAGTASLGNLHAGVTILSTPANTIGGTVAAARNVISGNGGEGVTIANSAASGNLVQGNFIGTNAAGTVALGNAGDGVSINGANGTIVGGTGLGAGNVISGNSSGVTILNATGNLVQGNLIGTNAAGTAALGNHSTGVNIAPATGNNTIGGTVAAARNVISGNVAEGVRIAGSGNLVQGNFIGTNVSGTAAVPNSSGTSGAGGVLISFQGNTIGGTVAAARNVISGNNGHGVSIVSTFALVNLVQGNFIGTDVTGVTAVPNTRNGVFIDQAASTNSIGGTASGAGNTIAFNGFSGVFVASGTGNAILRNAIHSNTLLGIDLAPLGVTPNDAGDGDTGANNLQNFPVLTSAVSGTTSTTIQGTLNSTPSRSFLLDFFASTACDASGFGEGQAFLTSTLASTAVTGNASFTVTVTPAIPVGQSITATATDNSTSEFSQCRAVTVTAPIADIRVSPLTLALPATVVGSESLAIPVQVLNAGLSRLRMGAITLEGTNLGEFRKTVDHCSGQVLVPGQRCSVTVSFHPSSAGMKGAALVVHSSDPTEGLVTVAVSGRAK
jgi:hypothetical protein